MSTFFEAVMNTSRNVLQWYERARLRERFLAMDDRLLTDIGISRDLLKVGVDAWPWRMAGEQRDAASEATLSKASVAQAIAELKVYSDAELADLDLRRGIIEYAVQHGRPDHPEDKRLAA